MGSLKSDSAVSRRIVRAFFDFLDSVEPAPDVDPEALEVARECLTRAFDLDVPSADDDHVEPGFLINAFRSLEANGDWRVGRDDGPGPSASRNADDWALVSGETGVSKDELFAQLVGALEKALFLRTRSDGSDDPIQLERARRLFQDAVNEMENNNCQSCNQDSLAETLKSLGNKAMQSMLYANAIEYYTCAIALSENNAVYYCNRAAAYTHLYRCDEAIRDCLKSMEIDPHYSKAYSRLGLVYYAQRNYKDALEKGFKKALHLDPNNEVIKENIRVAEQKLKEQMQRPGGDQPTSSSDHVSPGPNSQPGEAPRSDGPLPFPMPFNVNINSIPVDLSSMFNMASNAHMGRPEDGEHGARVDGNIDLNFTEGMSADLGGALRSMMSMFSGAAPPQGNPQGSTNGRSSTN